MIVRKALKIKLFIHWKNLYRFFILGFNFCLFYFLTNKISIESQILFITSSLIYFTLINYIFDKEFSNIRINSKDFLRKLISRSLLSSLINSLFLTLNINFFSQADLGINFLKFFFLFFTFILLISSFLKFAFLLISKFFSKTFLFIGNQNEYHYFSKIVKKSYSDYRIYFEDFKNISKIKVSNIIVNDAKQITSEIKLSEGYNLNNIKIYNITKWVEKYLGKLTPDFYGNNFKFNFKIFNPNSLNFKVKRLFDILITGCLILFTLPFLLIAIILIYLEDGRPIFYSQIRTGLRGKTFKIWKLRTMHNQAEKSGAQWSKASDPRVTRVGFFLRKFRIDELPQLLNVIKKEMSLIGPRPERPEFDKDLRKEIPHYYLRYNITPGLSGWAQVNYPYAASKEEVSNKLSYDLYYLKNFSIFLDFLILLKTIKLVFNARGSVPNSTTN